MPASPFRLFRRVAALFTSGARDRDMDREMAFHVESLVGEYVRSGITEAEARREARRRFGSVLKTKEDGHDARRPRLLEDGLRDVQYAVRTLRRAPAFALTTIFSLATGIAATTLVFSIVNALVFKRPPVADPDRVLFVEREGLSNTTGHSFPQYRDLRDRAETFESLAGYSFGTVSFNAGTGSSSIYRGTVTGNYFSTLGVRPALGRLIGPAEDRPGAPLTAVLSWDFWTTQFNGSPAAIGSTVQMERRTYTVIGVAPKGFHGLEVTMRPPLWTPMRAEHDELADRTDARVFVVGRLKPGISPSAADANLKSIAAEIVRAYPDTDSRYQVHLTTPGWLGDGFRAPIRAFGLGVLVLGLLVLLTACANLATSLTARAVDRHREIAIRMSLGAGRWRVVRLVAIETMVIAVAGGAIALAITVVGTNLLSGWWVPIQVPTQVDVRPDARVFLFAAAVTVFAALITVLAPSRLLMRLSPNAVLRSSGMAFGNASRWALRDVLVGVQVVLCCVLVAACLLSLVGFRRAFSVPLGFDPVALTVVRPDFDTANYRIPQRRPFLERAAVALSALPGVESVGYGNMPMASGNPTTVYLEGATPGGDHGHESSFYSVSQNYFHTLRVPLLRGRRFEVRDSIDSPRVAVVNQAFARQVLQSNDPIGQRFHVNAASGPLVEVIGIVPDGKYRSVTEAPFPAAFIPIEQAGSGGSLFVRGAAPADNLRPSIVRAVAEIDLELPTNVQSVYEAIDIVFLPSRLAAYALTSFGVLALLLAVNGMYAIVSHAVARRRREIGIRLALGARAADVLWLVLGRMTVVIAGGIVAGLAIAVGLARILGRVVYLAEPTDPLVLVLVVTVIFVAGGVATLGPALRSLRIQPAIALKLE